MMFNKGKCRGLQWGRNKPKYHYRLTAAEKGLEVLVNGKLSVSQQCAFYSQEGHWYPRVHLEECDQQVEGGEPPPLLGSSEATSGVLCPVLGSSTPERQGATGEGPEEGYRDD
ncbi:rna-directed dna polymerase from mobile element jockey-like [Willisornis vidua]|uniref:Rna-directed dna polymerase from mobile element jockey-like n=1 Tax=Willisornis vidua TaxID=1566151 RepID=A0ABQ9DMW2_9PASS|nr:rna-directed dna polymerase from mobile element jockey-like [Willisornis vidua]